MSIVALIGIVLLMGIVKKTRSMIDFALEMERFEGLPLRCRSCAPVICGFVRS